MNTQSILLFHACSTGAFSPGARLLERRSNSGLVVSRRSCYRAAADRIGLPSALFERLFNACFADRPDPLHALNDSSPAGRGRPRHQKEMPMTGPHSVRLAVWMPAEVAWELA